MMLHSGELPLRGAARSKEEAASWGSSTAVLRGAAGMGEGGGCFWEELPLRGAARLWEGGAGCVWGSSRCAELLDRGREEAAPSGGAPAARGCSIRRKEEALLISLGELPLRGAAGMGEGG